MGNKVLFTRTSLFLKKKKHLFLFTRETTVTYTGFLNMLLTDQERGKLLSISHAWLPYLLSLYGEKLYIRRALGIR